MSAPSLIIVGAGPAGLSAAVTAAAAGMAVTLIDERLRPGGRLLYDHTGGRLLEEYLRDCEDHAIEIRSSTVAWGIFSGWQLSLEGPDGPEVIESENVLLATGSTDRSLTFDGNALPGVMTGSGLRRLIREFGVLPGKRVLILGDGSDAAATANAVRVGGGEIAGMIAESEARALVATGESGVEQAALGDKTYDADIIAVAVGRQPDNLLAAMAEVELAWEPAMGGWVPMESPETDAGRPGLSIGGDAAGVDSVAICELDGKLAAATVCHRLGLIEAGDLEAIRAEMKKLRPDRLADRKDAPHYEQPWRVPLEVNG